MNCGFQISDGEFRLVEERVSRREAERVFVWWRGVILLVLVGCGLFYGWFALRSDGRLMTIEWLPRWFAYFFDLNPRARNFPAFAVLGGLLVTLVAGLDRRWQVVVLALSVAAPVLKDVVQAFTATRHFGWLSILLGVGGGVFGWVVAGWIARIWLRKGDE